MEQLVEAIGSPVLEKLLGRALVVVSLPFFWKIPELWGRSASGKAQVLPPPTPPNHT